jgi:hypothetical protein
MASPNPLGDVGRFHIVDWAAVGLGHESKDDWRAWHGGVPSNRTQDQSAKALPILLRRRVTPAGQRALRAAYALAHDPRTRYVFCSRHGEFQRTLGLLQTIATKEPTSPADFSLSVHNALAGLLSMASKSQAGHTAIAAGHDSFGFGVLEALSCLAAQPDEPILLVFFDDHLPAPYAELPDSDHPGIAVALLLSPGRGDPNDLILSIESRNDGSAPLSERGQALDFLSFLLSEQSELICPGGRTMWRWRRAH